ncbi:MAG: hydrogenase iron-sulfur subunit [Anaerolineales bacterium]|nr:hydrogenase iron-sulfur subunit [Anaerolineales bacterium]
MMKLVNPIIIVYTCNWNAYSGLEAAGSEGVSYPASIHPVRVVCLARMHPGLILKSFEMGAAGVMMMGCPPGKCHYGHETEMIEQVFKEAQELIRVLGIDQKRLKLDWIEAEHGRDFADKVREFASSIQMETD